MFVKQPAVNRKELSMSNNLPFPPFPAEPGEAFYDCGTSQMQLYYGQNKAVYDTYVQTLQDVGFVLHDTHNIASNYHSTFTYEDILLHIYYCDCEHSIRVICDRNTPSLQCGEKPFETRCDTMLYQFETDHTLIDCGMCYILQCADGSFFLIDSGHFFSFNDNDRIHKFLRERTPEGEKIVIAGWYFSHGHNDHICKFLDFLQYNCGDVVIEGLYYNFIPLTHPDHIHWDARDAQIIHRFHRELAAHPEIPQYRLHTGQHFRIRNLSFSVLYTHEDAYPQSCAQYNTSSSVLLLHADGTQVLFPGDASGIAADILLSRYGSLLKSDIIQIAHHGHFGLSTAFYETVQAEITLFPTTQIKYDEEFLKFEANRCAVALCKYCYISSNGTVAIPLPYPGGGAVSLPDETFEDFHYINRLWGYSYTDERKKELTDAFALRSSAAKTSENS